MECGRKSVPTALKILTGNPGKRPINKEEPDYKPLELEIPEQIKDPKYALAQREWLRILPLLLTAGVATEIDATALIGYCIAYQCWLETEEVVRDEGYVVQSDKGRPIVNPNVRVAQMYLIQMRSLMADFGMTPASRSKVKASPKLQGEDPMEKFLARGKVSA